MIRVLNVTKSTGGIARYNYRLSQRIDRQQFDWHVLCLSENNQAYASELEALGHTAFLMDMDRYNINVFSDIGLLRKLTRLIQEGDYDIVVGHGSKAGFLVRMAGRLAKTHSVYGLHSMSFVPRIHGNKAHLYRLFEHVASALTDGHIVVLSQSIRAKLLELGLTNEDNITTIYTGIDLEQFKPNIQRDAACRALGLDPSRPVCGWAARFVPQKAPLAFLDVMENVVARVPNVQIFMAGDGELKPETIQRAEQMNLAKNIIFPPWQNDINRMLSAFDVYILNSRWEGLPQSLLEAMAMECACVTSNVDGNAEVIEHGISGFIHDPDATEAMAADIVRLLEDSNLRRTVGQAARQRVKSHFSVQKWVDEWQDLLTQLAEKRPV